MAETVLVLEDDEDSLAVLEAFLEMQGFSVRTARRCVEAESMLAAGGIDALISDYSLGDGDAVQLLRKLGERRPRVAFLLTGYGDSDARAASRDAGFDRHLVKPVAPDELERHLRAALASKGLP